MSRNLMRASLALFTLSLPVALPAQQPSPRLSVEVRGGANVPTFDIADVAKTGPSVGAGLDLSFSKRFHALLDGDAGFHNGVTGPKVDVYHVMAKLGVDLLDGSTPWFFIVNAGAGAMRFAVDGGPTYTYPAINVGAKIGYRVSSRVSLLVSPQGDIAFSKKAELATTNSWVWPFAAGLRIRF
jgi:hypothetical protein